MAKKQHDAVARAQLVKDELKRDAPVLAESLLGDGQAPDADRMSQADFIAYARAGWWDGLPKGGKSAVQFRTDLLVQMGPNHFLELAKKVLQPLLDNPPPDPMLGALTTGQPLPMPAVPTVPGQPPMPLMTTSGPTLPAPPAPEGGL